MFGLYIDNNIPRVARAIENAAENGVQLIAEAAAEYAGDYATHRSGRVAGSYKAQGSGTSWTVGSGLKYAQYEESGAGAFANRGTFTTGTTRYIPRGIKAQGKTVAGTKWKYYDEYLGHVVYTAGRTGTQALARGAAKAIAEAPALISAAFAGQGL